MGHSALAAGLIGLPSAILSGVAALWCGRNVDRFGRGLVVGGLYIALVVAHYDLRLRPRQAA